MSKALRLDTKLMTQITTMAGRVQRETELFSVFNSALIKIVKHYTVYLELTDRDVLHLKWRLVNYMKPSGLFGVLDSKTFWKPWCKHSHSHQNIKKCMADIPLSNCWGSVVAWLSLSARQSPSTHKQTIHKAARLLKSIASLLALSAEERRLEQIIFNRHFYQAILSDSCSGMKRTDISVPKFTSLQDGFKHSPTGLNNRC